MMIFPFKTIINVSVLLIIVFVAENGEFQRLEGLKCRHKMPNPSFSTLNHFDILKDSRRNRK